MEPSNSACIYVYIICMYICSAAAIKDCLLVHFEKPTLAMQLLTTFGVMGLIFHLSRARWRLGRGSSGREGGGREGRKGGRKEGEIEGREEGGRKGGGRETRREGGGREGGRREGGPERKERREG